MAVTLLAAAALVAIGLWAIAADDGGSTTAAGAAPSDDALTVVGDAACSWSMVGEDVVEGVTIIEERFECQLDVSDTRVSGTEVVDVTTRIDDWARGGTWTADGVITSEDGTWRGAGHGVVSTVGNLPFSPQQSPVNFGEMHYEGDDAFEGLTFHYYVAGTNSALGISGWIEGS
ncbi:MAG TPA: hypothetical protein VK866_14420 [Acidimicrobiales bacterium]|nr:hypothetical protein [Acidimicrobiales bacterium]